MKQNKLKTPGILFAIFAIQALNAQDIITLRNGDEIKAKVSKVGSVEIEYKKFDNQSGPIYTAPVANIFMIKYQNGSKDVFNTIAPAAPATPPVASAPPPPPASSTAEFTAADVFSGAKQLTWIGMDFTKAKFVGEFAQGFGIAPTSPEQIKGSYVPSWNTLVVNESNKYNIPAFLHANTTIDLHLMQKHNHQINTETLFGSAPNYTNDDIQRFVQEYSYTGSGIGVGYLVESFDKTTTTATFYFIAVDFASRKAIVIEKITGSPSGFGVRNYWAGAFLDALKNTQKSWKQWKVKY